MMSNTDFGVSMQEAATAVCEFSKIAFKDIDVDKEIFLINQNSNLSRFQKKRLTKKLLKMKSN